MSLFKSFFTWWDGPTWGTRLLVNRRGEEVGSDEGGNRYFRSRDGKRRWVIYAGENEASRVPPEWHGWLHKTTDLTPVEAPHPRRVWQQPHGENATGTAAAWRRPGSLGAAAPRARATGDYEAWRPDEA
jgi:NADH:ubiquinone oxidoreductase subunit